MKRYKATLTQEERQDLEAISSKGTHAAKTVLIALVLSWREIGDVVQQVK
jgi:hypothetical protein